MGEDIHKRVALDIGRHCDWTLQAALASCTQEWIAETLRREYEDVSTLTIKLSAATKGQSGLERSVEVMLKERDSLEAKLAKACKILRHYANGGTYSHAARDVLKEIGE